MKRIEKLSDLEKKMTELSQFMESLTKTNRGRSLVIAAGDPGLGKTYMAKEILEKHKKANGLPYEILDGQVTAYGLYKKMWQYREGGIIVLDDVNSIITDKKIGIPLLKSASDTYEGQKVSWTSRDNRIVDISRYDPKDNIDVLTRFNSVCETNKRFNTLRENGDALPNMFYFKGAFIIITNMCLETFDKISDGALFSRGVKVDIRVSLNCAINYVKKMSKKMNKFGALKIPKNVADVVCKYITTDRDVIKFYNENGVKPGLRCFGNMCESYIDYGKSALNLDTLEACVSKDTR